MPTESLARGPRRSGFPDEGWSCHTHATEPRDFSSFGSTFPSFSGSNSRTVIQNRGRRNKKSPSAQNFKPVEGWDDLRQDERLMSHLPTGSAGNVATFHVERGSVRFPGRLPGFSLAPSPTVHPSPRFAGQGCERGNFPAVPAQPASLGAHAVERSCCPNQLGLNPNPTAKLRRRAA